MVTTEELAFQQSVVPSRLTFVLIPLPVETGDVLRLAKHFMERLAALTLCRQKTYPSFLDSP
jgi:hypothetical protein